MKKRLIIFLITLLIPFLVSSAATAYQITLNSEADAYIDSSKPTTNFETQSLWVGHYQPTNVKRRSYLRFDLTGIPDGLDFTNAVLRLYVMPIPWETYHSIDAWFVPTDSWNQSTITWNNVPTAGISYISTTMGTFPSGTWVEWNVLSVAQSTYAGDKKLSIVLRDTNETTGFQIDNFVQWESTDIDHRPQLQVRGTPEPATVLLFTIGTALFGGRRFVRRKTR